MFGYITTSKEHLGEADYKTFCSYYCGLCKAMGRHCSQASRLGLSYDLTFLMVVLSSVVQDEKVLSYERCIIHPFKKRDVIKYNYISEYCAMMSTLLAYEKCVDDINDEKSIKAVLGKLLYKGAYKKARKNHGEISSYIKEKLNELNELERNNVCDIDIVADKFALILQKLFTPDFITDENLRRQLEWFGYNIGRWIYIMDAINDLERDYKTNSYNPLLSGNIEDIAEHCANTCKKLETSLTFTLESVAEAFDLMKLYRNYELLEKMIYVSLPSRQMQITQKYRRDI